MSSRWLGHDDVKHILYGATFLGGGGGGPLETAEDILNDFGDEMRIELLDLDDSRVSNSSYGAMVACLGSPEAMKTKTFGPDGVASFEAFQKAAASTGKTVKYLYSGEMGGFNTFAPMLVAQCSAQTPEERIKFLDVDANGRAVPELNTSLNAARGFPPYPVGMGTLNMSTPSGKCNQIVSYADSDAESERIARGICGVFKNQIGFSTWAMCKQEFQDHSVVGCVTKAEQVGIALEKAATSHGDPIEFLTGVMRCKLFGKATIVDKVTEIVAGFDCGKTTIQIADGPNAGIYTIDFQNENLVMRNEKGEAIITAPDIITMVCMDENWYAHPLNNASTEKGMSIELILCPVDDKWWDESKTPYPYTVWRSCLDRVGYTGEQIRYQD